MGGRLVYNNMTPNQHIRIDTNNLVGEFAQEQLSQGCLDRLRKYVEKTVPKHLVDITTTTLWDIRKHSINEAQKLKQIPADFDDNLVKWLNGTSYTTEDKQKFINEINERGVLEKKDRKCKCFVKAETYPEYKFPRPIKSRTDRFKAVMGPLFQAINDHLFCDTDWFIKKIPVEDRPKRIAELLLPADEFDCTDYSSFEAHFVAMMIYAIEFPLYMWLTRNLKSATAWQKELDTLLNENICSFKDFTLYCQSRASGEMNTSSGNGWANKTLFTYTARVKGATKIRGQFEGDDGVTTTVPRSSAPTTADFECLGWTCKMETVKKFEEASFCGIVADSIDLINVCDIRAYLADFGWTKQQYLEANETTINALIRAKGFSAIYQYPGCPIIEALGHYALRITKDAYIQEKMRKMIEKGKIAESRYKALRMREMFERYDYEVKKRNLIPSTTRALVARKFAIPIEKQIEIEQYLDSLTTKQQLDIDLDFPKAWIHNWNVYVLGEGFSPEPLNELAYFKKFISRYNCILDQS